ncbi:PTS transporter subunit IIC [Paenibacillus sp. L3-i20]|uniref:PTS transporter subunit IIC n=1 Tax=Paenibacillus sp. L3-i20 TaxID=2905833 RepID=UPI001EDF2E2A|nr:PTS transporter subunit IIC [Paenibacillus sp. L3-i20]GKU77064.1 PTS ascorbate transporter subunit IIC [Paenibacillus sp. L3-i20]
MFDQMVLSLFREPMFIIALFVFIGLITQRKSASQVASGTIHTLIGYTLILFGSQMIIESLSIFVSMFQNAFQLFGIVPSNESMMAILQMDYSFETTIVMFVGILANIVVARITRFKYIFLNGYYILYMASMIAAILTINGAFTFVKLISGGILLGFMLAIFPAITQPFVRKLTGDKPIAVGFFGTVGCLLSGYMGKWLFGGGQKKVETSVERKPTSKRKIGALPFFSDTNVVLTLFMMILFGGTALLTNKDVMADMSNDQNTLVFAIKYSIVFAAGFYVIISGVRMFTEQLLVSFKGISDKIVPNAIPAVDSSVLFPISPSLVVIGFVSSLVGGMCSAFIQAMLNMSVVIPGIMTHFFAGAASAFFGSVYGGKKGAIVGSFMQGVLISFLPILSLYIFQELHIIRTSFADSDFAIIGALLKWLL